MRAFEMVVLKELANRPVEGSLAEQDHSVEALLLDRAYEPLRIIVDDMNWPKLLLGGLTYGGFASAAPSKRLEWLKRARRSYDRFAPQPYEQLAKVLREQGHEEAATEVLIAKHEDPKRVEGLGWWAHIWHFVLGWTIAYGHRPWNAGWWILGFIAVGWLVFRGRLGNDLRETKTGEESHQQPNAFIYSVDAFVPLIDLHQAKMWLPSCGWLRWYLWTHTAFGWILTTLLVAGLTGLVR